MNKTRSSKEAKLHMILDAATEIISRKAYCFVE